MLPTHRSPPAIEHLSKTTYKSFCGLNRLVLRWLTVALTAFGVLYLLLPSLNDYIWQPSEFGFDYSIPPPLPAQIHPHIPSEGIVIPDDGQVWESRKNEVKESFKHAYAGYKRLAFPSDEVLPLSGGKTDKFNGWGVTLFDALDTMWIMSLREEFSEAVSSVENLKFNSTTPDNFASFFETVIRYLGGSLSAFALSKDDRLLRLADRLGQVLLPAFNATESGLPAYSVNVQTGEVNHVLGRRSILFAEATSCQLEFKYLAKLTGKKEYYQRAQHAMNVMYKMNTTDGLFADKYYTDDGSAASTHLTAGATVDSGYEYLLKQWILSGDKQAREQYIKSANGIIKNLIHITSTRGLMYVGDMDSHYGTVLHRLEHLSCYLPGTLALGAAYLGLSPEDRELHQWAAEGLAYTCYVSYADQSTGLGPDLMRMSYDGKRWLEAVNKWKVEGRLGKAPGTAEPSPQKEAALRDYKASNVRYFLRPETIESIFYMWRLTGDIKWRQRGYDIYQAIEKHCRTPIGYASVNDVDSRSGSPFQIDDMPSFFLAETLKYLYLLFDNPKSMTLDEWVFNTEAHPLPIFAWTSEEEALFNINGSRR